MRLRQDGLAWHRAGDEIVVLDLDGSVYLRLNGSAKVLWELLTEPRSEAELRDELVSRYGIDLEQAAADVKAFVAELRNRQLIES